MMNTQSAVNYEPLYRADPMIPEEVISLVRGMLATDKDQRFRASEALKHRAFELLKKELKVESSRKSVDSQSCVSFKEIEGNTSFLVTNKNEKEFTQQSYDIISMMKKPLSTTTALSKKNYTPINL